MNPCTYIDALQALFHWENQPIYLGMRCLCYMTLSRIPYPNSIVHTRPDFSIQ